MEIFYKQDTLFVNLDEDVNQENISNVKRKVFNIIDDYDIDNIVLNIIGSIKDDEALDNFVKEYQMKYDGKLSIK